MGLTVKELISIGARILLDGWRAESAAPPGGDMLPAESAAGPGDDGLAADAAREAEALAGFVTGFDKQKIFMNWSYEVDDNRCETYFGLAGRRAGGEPLQYITGEQYFMGLRFSVNPDVLIPRPETESLAEKAIEYLKARPGAKAVLDLCTGSGALAIAIAKACPRVRATAADVSEKALRTAEKNAQALGVATRISFIESDLFSAFESDLFSAFRRGAPARKFDLIVTNPPYIRTDDLAGLQREIKAHEPLTALDGGADGLSFYRRIATGAGAYMRTGACLMAEIGHDQAQDAAAIFSAAGFSGIEVFKDLAGRDRIVKAATGNTTTG